MTYVKNKLERDMGDFLFNAIQFVQRAKNAQIASER
jgi:hypothetical protein